MKNASLDKVYQEENTNRSASLKSKKPVVVYGKINQPVMQRDPDMLDKLDEYQLDAWKYNNAYRN